MREYNYDDVWTEVIRFVLELHKNPKHKPKTVKDAQNMLEFIQYEKEIDNVFSKSNMIAICTYSLDKCNADDVIDVINNHQFALTELEGEWALM
jgi:hypothetical protein